MSDSGETRVLLGRVVGLFGVKGWLKVFSYTDPREAILEYTSWQLSQHGSLKTKQLAEGKRHGKSVVVHLKGVDDRDSAAELLDAEIVVPRSDLPEAGEGQYYWADLEGLSVILKGGESIGRVARVLETGANDVLVVRGERERLIPFVMNEVIVDVDLEKRVITVDWEWD